MLMTIDASGFCAIVCVKNVQGACRDARTLEVEGDASAALATRGAMNVLSLYAWQASCRVRCVSQRTAKLRSTCSLTATTYPLHSAIQRGNVLNRWSQLSIASCGAGGGLRVALGVVCVLGSVRPRRPEPLSALCSEPDEPLLL
jgi:hypothetical protein